MDTADVLIVLIIALAWLVKKTVNAAYAEKERAHEREMYAMGFQEEVVECVEDREDTHTGIVTPYASYEIVWRRVPEWKVNGSGT